MRKLLFEAQVATLPPIGSGTKHKLVVGFYDDGTFSLTKDEPSGSTLGEWEVAGGKVVVVFAARQSGEIIAGWSKVQVAYQAYLAKLVVEDE
jgi:hypothetical protein